MLFWICSNFQWFLAQPGWNLRKFQLEQLEQSFSTHHLDRYTRCRRCCRLRRCPCLACLACCLQVSVCQKKAKLSVEVEGVTAYFDYHGTHIKGSIAREHQSQSIAIFPNVLLCHWLMRYIRWRITWYQTTAKTCCHTIFQYISLEERPAKPQKATFILQWRYGIFWDILSSPCKTSLTWWSGNLLGSISSLPTVPFSILAETKD